ncbi:hypothetical protein Q5P01_011040 [Channa striata]|uniref:C2H2-type domain-containing protein n=1 Tax=Channa striata TaxID=64152 RepID=A0AA88MT79_CHASR|nr:hypothetical protein Q5P01_011040 [Channa striata]
MDEAAAAAIGDDGAESQTRSGDGSSGNDDGQSAADAFDLKQCNIACKDCGLTFTHWEIFKTHLHQHALQEEEEQTGAELVSGREDDGENTDGNTCDMSRSVQTKPSVFIQESTNSCMKTTAPQQKHLRTGFVRDDAEMFGRTSQRRNT